MSWSFSFKGPALEVAKSVEKELEVTQLHMSVNKGDGTEIALHARVCHAAIVGCHGMKDKVVLVSASGHHSSHGHTFSMAFQPDVEPVVEAPVEPPAATKKNGKKAAAKED